ncbi:MAG TPA: hypothetical protein VM261_19320 [Kofleriaceae bacterium]|nr:hypothetical protein [Kofleriaceae bacterium]
MTLALLTAAVSAIAGLVAAMAAHARLWVLAPVRAFAVIAVAMAIAVHILPEAIDGAGWWVLVPFALGFVAPPLIARVAKQRAGQHRRLAAELSYAGVLVHQVADGVGLGVLAGGDGGVHWDFVIGVGAHTVPVVAVIALAFAELGGARAALLRTAGLFAATAAGILLTRADASFVSDAGPWLNAAVSGLLFHVLLHDADDRDVPNQARPLEALGAAAGAALPFLTHGDVHGPFAEAVRHGAGDAIVALAPVLVVGGVLAAIMAPHHRRSPGTILAVVAGPMTALALLAAAYLEAARSTHEGVHTLSPIPDAVGLVAAFILGCLAFARIATAGFMEWLGGGDKENHPAHHHHD